MIRFSGPRLDDIKRTNRSTLAAVKSWIAESDYQNSLFQYGLPAPVRHLIDAPVGNETTYSDVLAFLALDLTKEIRYLEIGVSVGKNFLQMLRQLHGALLVGFDIEDINPVLEAHLDKGTRAAWETMPGSLRKTPSSLAEYTFPPNSNRVRYLAGDIFDDASWAKLSGASFNLVFSDAYHSADALLAEWRIIKSLGLLDEDEFVFVWDDLGGAMSDAFNRISGEMRAMYRIPASETWFGRCRGWLGTNEGYHAVGVVRKLRGVATI